MSGPYVRTVTTWMCAGCGKKLEREWWDERETPDSRDRAPASLRWCEVRSFDNHFASVFVCSLPCLLHYAQAASGK